ncbi:MAG: hypothetical protein STSR0008_03770 [Ignavibacterium sp.]
MKYIPLLLLFFIPFQSIIKANNFYTQSQEDSVEIYLIDSFVPPENQNQLHISFSTSDDCKSKLLLDNKYEFNVSTDYQSFHQIVIDIVDLNFSSNIVPFIFIVERKDGKTFNSEKYEINIQRKSELDISKNYLWSCLFGGIFFLTPSFNYVLHHGDDYFSLKKEIPIISFYSKKFNRPFGYLALEYSHINNFKYKNYLSAGYKQLIDIPVLDYVAPGINLMTNFNGFNGISTEISLGLLKVYNVFTIYTRYRFNFQPDKSGSEFHEFSIGLYSSFFSFQF